MIVNLNIDLLGYGPQYLFSKDISDSPSVNKFCFSHSIIENKTCSSIYHAKNYSLDEILEMLGESEINFPLHADVDLSKSTFSAINTQKVLELTFIVRARTSFKDPQKKINEILESLEKKGWENQRPVEVKK